MREPSVPCAVHGTTTTISADGALLPHRALTA
jgi:hypothetical protein